MLTSSASLGLPTLPCASFQSINTDRGKRYHNSESWPEGLQGGLHHYLSQCHGSSCRACGGGTSVNVLPRSSIAVGTYGVVSLSCSDTSRPLNSRVLNEWNAKVQ